MSNRIARVAVVAALGVSCDERRPSCTLGFVPTPGETGVDRGTPVEIRIPDDGWAMTRPEELPHIEAAIGLRDEEGNDLTFEVDVDLRAGVIVLYPDQPFFDGVTYEIRGIDWSKIETWDFAIPSPHAARPTTSRFTIGGRPRPLAFDNTEWMQPAVVVFSEPMALTRDDVQLVDADGLMRPALSARAFDTTNRIWVFEHDMNFSFGVVVASTARSIRGPEVGEDTIVSRSAIPFNIGGPHPQFEPWQAVIASDPKCYWYF